MGDGHAGSVWEGIVLLQPVFDYLYGGLYWNRCKEGIYIIGGHDFSRFQPFALELLDEMLCVFKMMWGLAYKGFNDVGKLLGNTISDGPHTEHNGSEGDTCFVYFG